MRIHRSLPSIVVGVAFVSFAAAPVRASMTFSPGLPTSHVGNLVVNGSFEIAAPADGAGNLENWANTSATPFAVPPGWTSSGANSSAVWGNDGPGPYHLKASDYLPDGRVAVDFHTATAVTVSQQPTFNANGTVTFPATPVFSSPAGVPVVLKQTVHTEASPAPSYNLSFWISGEENLTVQGFSGAGIIGLRVTNVLSGDPIQWLAVPNGLLFGMSQAYSYSFTPLNSSLPVDVDFVNWGGMDLSAYGMSQFGTQPILDDVIINGVPEPATVWLLASGGMTLLAARRRRTAAKAHEAATRAARCVAKAKPEAGQMT